MDDTIDQEMIDELNKAYKLAYQYRMNTLRIRHLLDQSPITENNGQALMNEYTGTYLIHMLSDGTHPVVNSLLKLS